MDLQRFASSELTNEMIDDLIGRRESFQIVGVADIGKVVSWVEGWIEKRRLKCRVYTEYRRTALVGSMFSPTWALGLASGVAIGVHNLLTLNPDYEIGKNKLAGTVTVTYKK